MAKFELVQRLTDASDGRPSNVMGDPNSLHVAKMLLDAGSKVDLDFMGSYDYADSTLIRSANKIARAASGLKIVTRQLVLPGHDAEDIKFVCTDEQEETLLPEWDEWARNPYTREPSGFIRDEGDPYSKYSRTVGWWALEEDLIWSRREDVAENIRNAFVEVSSRVA